MKRVDWLVLQTTTESIVTKNNVLNLLVARKPSMFRVDSSASRTVSLLE